MNAGTEWVPVAIAVGDLPPRTLGHVRLTGGPGNVVVLADFLRELADRMVPLELPDDDDEASS